jgi:hypothetical protein
MKFINPNAILQMDRMFGTSDCVPYYAEENNFCRQLCMQACGFDLRRNDYEPKVHLPTNYALILSVCPNDRCSFTFHFELN